MLNDKLINAVIQMQSGAWTDEGIADEITTLFPDAVKDMNRDEVVSRITDYVDRHELSLEDMEAFERAYPDVIEAIKLDRTLTIGEAMIRLGHWKGAPKQ